MANHSSPGRRPATPYRCADSAGHGAEAFLHAGSVMAGCWEAAGLNPEPDAKGGLWGWKMMRCGCRFVVLMYPADTPARSRPSSPSISASVRTVAPAGSRAPVAPQSERPVGVGSSTVLTGSPDRRENHPSNRTPSRFQSMGLGGRS